MVEPVLYFVLGVLVTGVLSLFAGQALWRRAVRLTSRRVLRHVPVSASDVTAAADLARAQHAVLVNKLERKALALTRRIAEQMAEIGRYTVANQRLHGLLAERQTEAGTRHAHTLELEHDLADLRDRLTDAQAAQARTMAEMEKGRRQYAEAEAQRRELEMLSNGQNVQLASAQAENTSLVQRLVHVQNELDALRDDFKLEIEARVKAQQALSEARSKARDEVSLQLGVLEGQIERLKVEKAMLEGALSSARARGMSPMAVAEDVLSQFPLAKGEELAVQVAQWTSPNSKSEAARFLRSRSASRMARRAAANDSTRAEIAEKR
jgi:hypothetical protein